MMIKPYIQLLRPRHYLKNALIFLPLIFSGLLLNSHALASSVAAFAAFSLLASTVYIINDLRDKELDKLHPKKKFRPLASGAVSTPAAITMVVLLLVLVAVFQYLANFSVIGFGLLGFYLLINVLYSFGLKNIPIVDIAILSLGFVIRVFYGADAIDVDVSNWLYLAVLASSFYLGLGKRRNEIKGLGTSTRKVNRHYTQEFLDKNMYVCLGLTIVYYSLWAIDPNQPVKLMFLTVPVVIAIVMTYSLAVESAESDGDPVNVLMSSRPLIGLVLLYGALMTGLVYLQP